MKVFISWSGPLAGNVAEKLRTWLRKVIQVVEPFVSSQDIEKGDVWLPELLRELQESSVGIICVTRENLHRDWLLFESGALIRQMGRGRLCTLLIDVSPAEVAPPLSAFQSTTFKREDVFRLIQTIHSALERPRPLLLDAELEEQFEIHWPDLESHVRKALSAPAPQPSEIQELAQELLLPVIYREASNGDLDTVFHWLEIAKAKKVASLESQLAFVEASLARITGKRGAGQSLRVQSAKETELGSLAQLEYGYLQFANGNRLQGSTFDSFSLDRLGEGPKRTAYTILGLWHLREGRSNEAKHFLSTADPTSFSGDVDEHYRALPLGILCFALGYGEEGEKQFDLVRSGMVTRFSGYPFVSLLNAFDKAFVGVCIGQKGADLRERRIREFRGHAWVLIKYAELMAINPQSFATLAKISADWRHPLEAKTIAARLLQFQRKLLSDAGAPLLT